jgi:hypothetical protein
VWWSSFFSQWGCGKDSREWQDGVWVVIRLWGMLPAGRDVNSAAGHAAAPAVPEFPRRCVNREWVINCLDPQTEPMEPTIGAEDFEWRNRPDKVPAPLTVPRIPLATPRTCS